MTTTDTVGALRREIEGLAVHKTCRRYSPELQGRVVAWVRPRLAAGASIARVCAELGMGDPTLRRWLEATERGSPRFRRIRVAAAPPGVRAEPMVVRGPCGLRIDGLSVEGLAELLKRVSCLA